MCKRNNEIANFLYRKSITKLKNTKNEAERFYVLGSLAIASFNVGKIEEAKEYVNELCNLISNYKTDWNYWNAVQDINIILGRVAILDGRINDACKLLLEAGKNPGSPQMRSFGPNMSLAKDLLERGKRDVVVEYLNLCSKFWDKKDCLTKWINEIADGNIPDFGSNLYY